MAEVDGLPLAVTGGANGRLHALEVPDLQLTASTAGDTAGSIHGLLVLPGDNPVVVAGFLNGDLQAFRLPDLAPLTPRVSTGAGEIVDLIALDAQRGLAVGATGLLLEWSLGTDPPRSWTQEDHSGITAVTTVSVDGLTSLVTAHQDRRLRLWAGLGPTSEILANVLPGDVLVCLAHLRLRDLSLLIVGLEDSRIELLDLRTRKWWSAPLSGHAQPIWDLAVVAADDPIVFGASEDGEAHLWTLTSEEELTPTDAFDRHRWSYRRLIHDGDRVVALATCRFATALLDALAGTELRTSLIRGDQVGWGAIGLLGGHVRWATSLTNGSLAVDLGNAAVILAEVIAPGVTWTNLIRHDGSDELITVSDDGTLSRWELAADPPRKVGEAVLENRPQRITAVHVVTRPGSSPTLHLGHDSGLVGEWALDGSVVTPFRRVSSEAVTSLAYDGELVLAGTRTGTLVVMGQDGSHVVHARHKGTVQAILPVRVGHRRRVVLGSSDGWLTVVDPSNPDRSHDSVDLDAPVNDLLLLPGGAHVAAATDRGLVVLALSRPSSNAALKEPVAIGLSDGGRDCRS